MSQPLEDQGKLLGCCSTVCCNVVVDTLINTRKERESDLSIGTHADSLFDLHLTCAYVTIPTQLYQKALKIITLHGGLFGKMV